MLMRSMALPMPPIYALCGEYAASSRATAAASRSFSRVMLSSLVANLPARQRPNAHISAVSSGITAATAPPSAAHMPTTAQSIITAAVSARLSRLPRIYAHSAPHARHSTADSGTVKSSAPMPSMKA